MKLMKFNNRGSSANRAFQGAAGIAINSSILVNDLHKASMRLKLSLSVIPCEFRSKRNI